jgi:hypothetical protein
MGVIRPPFYCSGITNVKFLYNTLSLLYNIVKFHYKRLQMTSSTADKYTTTEYGKQNMFGAEVAPWVDQDDNYEGYAPNAEKTNGRWAMIGIVALLGAYITTGQIIPGVF